MPFSALSSKKLVISIIFSYLSDIDIIFTGTVDPLCYNIAQEILVKKKELKLNYRNDCKKDILHAIQVTGENLQKLNVEGDFDSDLFQVIHEFCPSLKTLEIQLNKSKPFEVHSYLNQLQNLDLKWYSDKSIPHELQKGIKDLLKKSPNLQNLHLINFEESYLEEIEFPPSLKGLQIQGASYWDLKNAEIFWKKIQSKDLEKLTLHAFWIQGKDFELLKEFGRNCVNIKYLNLNFNIFGYLNTSFLSEFPNLKDLNLSNDEIVYVYDEGDEGDGGPIGINLFQIFSLVPKIEILHFVDGFKIEDLNSVNLSELKSFGFVFFYNKYEIEQNLEKLKSLKNITFYDLPVHWKFNPKKFFNEFLYYILPYLEEVEIIEFVEISYEDYFYKRIKSLTQNREKKIRIKIKNENRNKILKDENDKFIFEEWSWEDYKKIHVDSF